MKIVKIRSQLWFSKFMHNFFSLRWMILIIIVTASNNKQLFMKLFLSIILKTNYSVEMNNKSIAFFLSLKNHFNFLK